MLQPRHEPVVDALVDEQPPQGRAALAGGPDRAEENRAGRHVEIGGGRDDERIVAAQLHHRAAEPAVHFPGHVEAHPRRAGGGDQRNPAIGRQFFSD